MGTVNWENRWNWAEAYKRPMVGARELSQAIHDSLEMLDVIHQYVPGTPIRGRRMPCPIHNGKDYNLSFTDNGFICFVCGAKGDVVSFVQQTLGLPSRMDAIRTINHDFNLGLPIDSEATRDFKVKVSQKVKEREDRERAHQEWCDKRDALEDEWAILDQIIRSPKSSEVEVAKANERIVRVQYLLNTMPLEPER